VIVSGHYPLEIRAINKRGLTRAGLTPDQQNSVFDAYKFIWRNSGPVMEHVNQLAGQNGLDEAVRAMIDSLLNSSKQRFGRHLELYR
jgi:acyl-[acyl carrier protein]--UDP-N-acetylglucosamine O-acyltransferase